MPPLASPAVDTVSTTPPSSTWSTALRLLRFAVRVDPRMFLLTVATALVGSLAEGLGLVLLLPLLSVAGMNFSGASTASRLASTTQHLLLAANVPHSLWLPAVLGIFLATGAVRSIMRRSQSMMVFTTTARVQLALSRRVYESVVKAQWGFLVRQRAGRLTHVLTAELRRVTDATMNLLSLINLACLTLLYMAVALKLSAPMTLLVLAIGAVMMLQQRHALDKMRNSGRGVSDAMADVYAATDEHLLNLKSVKTNNAEQRDAQLFADLCGEVARYAADNASQQASASFWFELGSLVVLGVVIFLALGVLHVQPATMLLMLAIFTRLMPQLAAMQSQAQLIASTLPSFDHVLAIEAECLMNGEPSGPEAKTPPLKLEREFRLTDVWFAYATDSQGVAPKTAALKSTTEPKFVLRGIDLPIAAGLLTAVVGPSGAGKSTIADLVNGLLQPTRGSLILDGRILDAAQIQQWRRQVGYVGQETVLFHTSVRENLLWAQPDATDDDLREALLLASAGFVYDLPGGLESIVGDRGILLSSGQRQRISLARALLRKPALLILDEATNALDVENEARVLEAIRAVIRDKRGAMTVLMIAHRASAIQRADRIFELEDGRIARSGTWEQLHLSSQPVALN
jgi:ATP-binding cassette, subfamily C, bacterial